MADRARETPVLTTPGELSAAARRAGRLFLFCDYDGTLVPIAPTPARARPDRNLLEILTRLAAAPGTRVAVISGRDLRDLAALLPLPGLYLAGCHGAELRRPGGEVEALCPDVRPALAEAARRVRPVLAGRRGFLLEEKRYSLALHYRLADPGETPGVLEAFRQAAGAEARRHGLVFTPGKKVLELRPRNVHKGAAVQRLLNDHPGALPVYLGDDVTDESAFAVLAEWKAPPPGPDAVKQAEHENPPPGPDVAGQAEYENLPPESGAVKQAKCEIPPADSNAANRAEYQTMPAGRDTVTPAKPGGAYMGENSAAPIPAAGGGAGVSVRETAAPLNHVPRGTAITVLVSAGPRPSAARYRLPDPAAVNGFLHSLARALGAGNQN